MRLISIWKKSVVTMFNDGVDNLLNALADAINHLEWIGYGDNYEREVARLHNLPERLSEIKEKYSLDEWETKHEN